MRFAFLALSAFLSAWSIPASASTSQVKLVFVEAEWCGFCGLMEPKVEQALEDLGDPAIEYQSVDLTRVRGGTDIERSNFFFHELRDNMTSQGLGDFYPKLKAFGANTGYVLLLASDTHEPLFCGDHRVTVDELKAELKTAKSRVAGRPPNQRLTRSEAQGSFCLYAYHGMN